MKDKDLTNKIKRKADNLQEPSIEGAGEGLVKNINRKSFNGDLNMNKVIFVHNEPFVYLIVCYTSFYTFVIMLQHFSAFYIIYNLLHVQYQ